MLKMLDYKIEINFTKKHTYPAQLELNEAIAALVKYEIRR